MENTNIQDLKNRYSITGEPLFVDYNSLCGELTFTGRVVGFSEGIVRVCGAKRRVYEVEDKRIVKSH